MCVVGQVDMEGVRLNFWDLGGQEELQSLWDKVSTFTYFTADGLFRVHQLRFLFIFIH